MDSEELTILNKIEDIMTKGKQAHFSWLRHVLTMSSGLIAIIVALHTHQSSTFGQHLSFVAAVALLAFGILCGSVALYSEIQTFKYLGLALVKELDKRRAGEGRSVDVIAFVPKIFTLAQYGCYISLSAALIALVIYACVLDASVL